MLRCCDLFVGDGQRVRLIWQSLESQDCRPQQTSGFLLEDLALKDSFITEPVNDGGE